MFRDKIHIIIGPNVSKLGFRVDFLPPHPKACALFKKRSPRFWAIIAADRQAVEFPGFPRCPEAAADSALVSPTQTFNQNHVCCSEVLEAQRDASDVVGDLSFRCFCAPVCFIGSGILKSNMNRFSLGKVDDFEGQLWYVEIDQILQSGFQVSCEVKSA